MASIRKRNNRWQVQVRSRIYGSISNGPKMGDRTRSIDAVWPMVQKHGSRLTDLGPVEQISN